jgi:uncharacterized protein
MPSRLTYPGVYIEEIPSGVRTITGVATSITAFIGWAPQGPTDRALRIFSFTDYERKYGGLHPQSDLSYSVKQFFENGGGDAYILRITKDDATKGTASVGDLEFTATSPGVWSRFYAVKTAALEGTPSRFSLSVLRMAADAQGDPDPQSTTLVERFVNLSLDKNDPRYVREIVNDLEQGSQYVSLSLPDDADDFGGEEEPVALSPGQDEPLSPGSAEFLTALDGVIGEDKALDQIDLFNLLCVPGMTDGPKQGVLEQFCKRRRAFLIADCEENASTDSLKKPPITGTNGAFFFPWIKASDPLAENRLSNFPPCGFVAGIIARTDAARGIWKAPAGIDATLVGIYGPAVPMTNKQNGELNIRAVNCIRTLPTYGTVVWGARTLNGDDDRGDEWKYIPVRRTALFIEESLYRGTHWAVFEPNDEPLWSQMRLNIGAFMHDLFRQGAFQGRTPREAYFVKCDKETTTQNDINRGVVNVIVGFAPLKPAEFVVIKLTQIAGQIET